MVDYSAERDEPAGRIEVRPAPNRNLPFGDMFERFVLSWSFLNVMGYVRRQPSYLHMICKLIFS